MARKTTKKKSTTKRTIKSQGKTPVSKKDEEKSSSITDAAFAVAIKDLFSPEERVDIIKEHNLMLSCKQAFNDILTAAEALGVKDEFKDCAFCIDAQGRYFPIDQEMFDEEALAYESDEGEDDGEDGEYNPASVIKDLKAYMKEADLSQTDMAENLKCSQGAVSTWLRGESLPRQAYCEKIAELIYE
jgi:DNA-binding XRE family transcriptional regulator